MRKIKTGKVNIKRNEFKKCRVEIDEREYKYLKALKSWAVNKAAPIMNAALNDDAGFVVYLQMHKALCKLPLKKNIK